MQKFNFVVCQFNCDRCDKQNSFTEALATQGSRIESCPHFELNLVNERNESEINLTIKIKCLICDNTLIKDLMLGKKNSFNSVIPDCCLEHECCLSKITFGAFLSEYFIELNEPSDINNNNNNFNSNHYLNNDNNHLNYSNDIFSFNAINSHNNNNHNNFNDNNQYDDYIVDNNSDNDEYSPFMRNNEHNLNNNYNPNNNSNFHERNNNEFLDHHRHRRYLNNNNFNNLNDNPFLQSHNINDINDYRNNNHLNDDNEINMNLNTNDVHRKFNFDFNNFIDLKKKNILLNIEMQRTGKKYMIFTGGDISLQSVLNDLMYQNPEFEYDHGKSILCFGKEVEPQLTVMENGINDNSTLTIQ